MNEAEDSELRLTCSYALSSLGSRESLRAVEAFVRSANARTRRERALISTIIIAFIRHGTWKPVDALRSIPNKKEEAVVDSTAILPSVIIERLNFEQARMVVQELSAEEINELERQTDAKIIGLPRLSPRVEVFRAAVELVAKAAPDAPEVLQELIPFCLALGPTPGGAASLLSTIRTAFSSDLSSRRQLVLAVLERPGWGHSASAYSWGAVLKPEDLEWLMEQVPRLSTQGEPAGWLALRLAENHQIDESVRLRVRAEIGRLWPGLVDSFDGGVKQQAFWQQEREKRELEQRERTRSLLDVINEVLFDEQLDLQQKMWRLARVVFPQRAAQVLHLEGTWDGLPEGVREAVLEVCQEALDVASPTPLPKQLGRIPGHVLFEAWTFVALLRVRPERFVLTEKRLQRWLPAVLRGLVEEKSEVLENGYSVAPEMTEELVLAEARREIEQNHYSVLLQDMPQVLWTPKISRWVDGIVNAQDDPAEKQARLLRLLAGRAKGVGVRSAERVVSSWIDGGRDEDLVFLAALDILLAEEPEMAWPIVRWTLLETQGEIIRHLHYLAANVGISYLGRLRVTLETWPSDRLVELADFLIK